MTIKRYEVDIKGTTLLIDKKTMKHLQVMEKEDKKAKRKLLFATGITNVARHIQGKRFNRSFTATMNLDSEILRIQSNYAFVENTKESYSEIAKHYK